VNPLPTRNQEDWRYANIPALEKLWPLPAPEAITVPAGGTFTGSILNPGGVLQIALTLEAKSSATIHILNAGGDYARVEVTATLHEGADFTLGGVQIAGGTQSAEIIAKVHHIAPNATSQQILRSVAAGQASASVQGKVHVAKGADGTDGQQSMRAMLLDRTAQANAKPELEIYADDVKCAHGCAIGELDQNGLFYLAARGIEPARAKALMLQAFIAEAMEGADDNLQAQAQAALEAVL
jgi:Fe-S cluster assembly protein SufD